MAIGKSFNLKKQKMTKESIRIFWAHTEARKDFCRHHIEPRSSIVRAKKRILFHCVILIWWTYADLEIAQEKEIYAREDVDKNRNLSELWTGFHKIYVIERKTLERVWQTREEIDENSDNITSRSCMAWHIDKNLEKRICIRETVDP